MSKASLLSPRARCARAKRIRLLAMDVDGVLTDGKIVILDSGEEIKMWDVKDRIGFFMLKKFPGRFHVAWITGRKSKQVETRAGEIGTAALFQHCDDKGTALETVVRDLNLTLAETLFIGDDLVDLPALRRAGLAVCPSDASPVIKRVCHWITRAQGGHGAVREVVDAVLDAQGLTGSLLEMFEKPALKPNP